MDLRRSEKEKAGKFWEQETLTEILRYACTVRHKNAFSKEYTTNITYGVLSTMVKISYIIIETAERYLKTYSPLLLYCVLVLYLGKRNLVTELQLANKRGEENLKTFILNAMKDGKA